MQDGYGLDAALQEEGARSDGAAELMAGDGEGVGAAGGEVDGNLACCLDGVGVEEDAAGMGDLGELGDGLDGADLVVGPHDAD
jgi:hypothetical protein